MIRHGMTAGNAERRYIGVTDEPLSPEGRAEAERKEKDLSLDRVYVSPLTRARQTAAILFPNAVQIPVEDLREMDFGVFEGRSGDEMEHDPVYREWVENRCTDPCPGGESQEAFYRRTLKAFADVMRTAKGEVTFLVHGGVIMSIFYQLAVPKRDFYDWAVPNLSGFEADCVEENGVLALKNVRPIA